MTNGLPDGRQMWIRAFYGFDPSEAGYVGWSQKSAQEHALKKLNDGDLMLIYGAATSHTPNAFKSHVIGFVEIESRPIMDDDKSSDASLQSKKDNGFEGKWKYGLPIKRAWMAEDKLSIEKVAPVTYDKKAGQAIGVWGKALSEDEIQTALKIRVREVNVYGEEPIEDSKKSKKELGAVFKPSKAFPGSSGTRTSEYIDGETFLYLARFEGDSNAFIGKPKVLGNKSIALKIGVSNNLDQRFKALNSGIPPAAMGKWTVELSAKFPDRISAEKAEKAFKDSSGRIESLGGEFFWCELDDAKLLFAQIQGVSHF